MLCVSREKKSGTEIEEKGCFGEVCGSRTL
jgi:hypothetical protein